MVALATLLRMLLWGVVSEAGPFTIYSLAIIIAAGSNSTELAKARISFLSAMPPIATDPVCHIELSEVP